MLSRVKWLKFLLALIFLPLVAALGLSLADVVWRWAPTGGWRSLVFLSGAGGFSLWLLVYYLLPRPMWMYVLGHELTHAWAVWLAGGRVYDFKVTSDGGHVKSDRVNWFIGLAPYFVPLYSLLWMMLWLSVDFWYPLNDWQWVYGAGLGFTWGFHVTFTLSMIKLGQTDISEQGYLFSFVCITSANLLVILLAFALAGSEPGAWGVLQIMGNRLWQCYRMTGVGIWSAYRFLADLGEGKSI